MEKTTSLQLIKYPGAQKSALLGMKDIFEYAGSQAETHGSGSFLCSITAAPEGIPGVAVLPPALTSSPGSLPDEWAPLLCAMHRAGTVLASVCSGAFLLAGTGLLNGRRVTTHWSHADGFRQRFPSVTIDTDRLLLDDGDIVTAGGVMAWTDLSLHLVERFGGRALMLHVARQFVLDPPERQQSYYASFKPVTNHADQAVSAAQQLLHEAPHLAHSLASLAEAAALSERSLLRRFKQATGLTPVAYLQNLRVEMARSRLELTRDSFEQISWDAGYSDAAAFRRVFRKIAGLSPSDYRRRFGLPGASSLR
jgi:transcriptional regulator GlxA family with amidase domain